MNWLSAIALGIQATQPITVEEAVKLGLLKQPSLRQVAAQVQAAEGRVKQAAAPGNPSLTLSSTYTQLRNVEQVPTGNVNAGGGVNQAIGFNTNLNLSQVLYDFGAARISIQQASSLRSAAVANLDTAQANLVLQIKVAFYGLNQAAALVKVGQVNLEDAEANLRVAQARADAGIGLPIDVVRAKTNRAQAEVALVQARENLDQARFTLARAMGIDGRVLLQPAASHEAVPAELNADKLLSRAFDQRPELRFARFQQRAARFGETFANRGLLPTFNLTLGYNGRGDSGPFLTQRATAVLQFSFPIFDGGLTQGRRQEARANFESAIAQTEDTTEQVRQDVLNALNALQSAEARERIAADQVANATQAVRIAEGRYRAGFATFIEITDAQAALLTARTNQVNAAADVDRSRAILNRAIGTRAPV